MPFKQGVRGSNPRWSTKKYPSPFGGGYFFRSLPGSRSLSPSGEIPAGAPKNIPRLSAGEYFFRLLPGRRSLSPSGEIPAGAPKNLLAFWRGIFFSGRSRGVEVYPRQGKSPLEHQKSASITVCLQIFTFSFFTLHYSLHCKMCWRMAIVYFTAPHDCRHPALRTHNHYLQ